MRGQGSNKEFKVITKCEYGMFECIVFWLPDACWWRLPALSNIFSFWNSNSLLWQDGGGQSRENTKIASSDLSFINFSTPAATHWNRLWQRKKSEIKLSDEVFIHRLCCWASPHKTWAKNMECWTQTKDLILRIKSFSQSTSYRYCSTLLHFIHCCYCQHYKYTPWMLNYIIQLGNSLPSTMWL